MAEQATPDPAEASAAARISRHVVRTLSEYTGRGPTKAHTTISGELVATLLSDTLTKGERSLVADGRTQTVLEMRKAFQMTMREELARGVEEIVGRPVVAFFSDNNIDPDMSIEAFVMGPAERA